MSLVALRGRLSAASWRRRVEGWVAVEVSVADEWQLGEPLPDEAVTSALGSSSGWEDFALEASSYEVDAAAVAHG
jgi:hypothetical protein